MIQADNDKRNFRRTQRGREFFAAMFYTFEPQNDSEPKEGLISKERPKYSKLCRIMQITLGILPGGNKSTSRDKILEFYHLIVGFSWLLITDQTKLICRM